MIATSVIYVPDIEVSAPANMPHKVPEVPGTRKVHFVKRILDRTGTGTCRLEFCRQSCFKESESVFREQVYSMEDDEQMVIDDEGEGSESELEESEVSD